jgi:hypothetical protein
MLAEKFFLLLETIISHASDGSPRVVSTSPRVPIKPPNATITRGQKTRRGYSAGPQ